MTIDSFSGAYDFLSNFYPVKIYWNGKMYDSVEHAYQAAKTDDPELHEKIRTASTAGKAKRLGAKVKLTPDWSTRKLQVMNELVNLKFQNIELAEKLLSTGDEELVEGNWWNDTFWGVSHSKGENNLGKILMACREKLRNE